MKRHARFAQAAIKHRQALIKTRPNFSASDRDIFYSSRPAPRRATMTTGDRQTGSDSESDESRERADEGEGDHDEPCCARERELGRFVDDERGNDGCVSAHALMSFARGMRRDQVVHCYQFVFEAVQRHE